MQYRSLANATLQESPRWLASVGRSEEALKNLAYLRRASIDSPELLAEMAVSNGFPSIVCPLARQLSARRVVTSGDRDGS